MTWSIYALCITGFIIGIALVLVCLVRGGLALPEADAAPPLPPVRKPRGPLADGYCPQCGEAGIYLTRAGAANRRYHVCGDGLHHIPGSVTAPGSGADTFAGAVAAVGTAVTITPDDGAPHIVKAVPGPGPTMVYDTAAAHDISPLAQLEADSDMLEKMRETDRQFIGGATWPTGGPRGGTKGGAA